MTNLKQVNVGYNKFCGPAVLSILTGKDTDECARVITSINGKYNVTGVILSDLLKAAKKLGYESEMICSDSGSLYRTLVSLSTRDGIYIITVPMHFIVIEVNNGEIFFNDNHTKEPIRAASSARLMQQCLACYRVEKRKDYVEPEPLKLISKDIIVEVMKMLEGNHVEIRREYKYNHAEHNRVEVIGRISSLHNGDLYEIHNQLDKIVNEIVDEKEEN